MNVWKPSKGTKACHEFVDSNHVDHRFAGAGSNEGNNFKLRPNKNSDKVDVSKLYRKNIKLDSSWNRRISNFTLLSFQM